ncbi:MULTISPECIES: hypothetical protein [Streptomyces]|uniref:hypothetical protein n=1 Tax=Streptomyces TaxID=1883 RepID=UPI000DD68050|nr:MULTISPECIES: hypothetical protein [Streptomyces]MDX3381532.1 hypothetical protein [Streptomyces niveiscabiei]QZZ26872.1 hypothetical protein A7X85_11930 [Streptomyces sp. ST1015]
MQHPVVPELAHTHTRPIHWVATATALAGVVALSSVIQPGPATAAQPTTKADDRPAAVAPSVLGVKFPLDCGPVKALVVKQAAGDLDGDGRPETVAVVHCDAPMGTPPDSVYVLTRGPKDSAPRVVATLVTAQDRNTVTTVAVTDGAVRASILGYSTPDVPRCCPDVKSEAQWRWKDDRFVRTAPAGAHSV